MSDGKHTNGPWRAYRRADYTTPGWVILWPDTSKPGVHYRRLDSNGGFLEEDAHLIAAAPELRSTAMDTLSLIENLADNIRYIDRVQALEAALRAAIAKAHGGTTA